MVPIGIFEEMRILSRISTNVMGITTIIPEVINLTILNQAMYLGSKRPGGITTPNFPIKSNVKLSLQSKKKRKRSACTSVQSSTQ